MTFLNKRICNLSKGFKNETSEKQIANKQEHKVNILCKQLF